MRILHAGLIALRLRGAWRGALVLGPSGCGKSDLALRALAEGFRLVADDRTVVFASAGRLFGRAPATLDGLFEARGAGIGRQTALPVCEVALGLRCAPPGEPVERLPELEAQIIEGVSVPFLPFAPLDRSAAAKLRLALTWTAVARGVRSRASAPEGGAGMGSPLSLSA